MMSGYDFLKSQVLRRWQNADSDWDVVMSSGRVFQTRGPATVRARLPTVESLTGGTSRRLVPAERNVRRPGRSATGTRGPKYRGALPLRTLYVSTATLYSYLQLIASYWHTNVPTDVHHCQSIQSISTWQKVDITPCQPFSFLLSHLLVLGLRKTRSTKQSSKHFSRINTIYVASSLFMTHLLQSGPKAMTSHWYLSFLSC